MDLNFNQYGINHTINQTPESWRFVNTINNRSLTIDIVENINTNTRQQLDPRTNRFINMLTPNVATLNVIRQNGVQEDYDILQQCGQGSFGTVYRIRRNGVNYALKRQQITRDHPINPVIKEAMINIMLNATTQVPHMHLIGKNNDYVYMITECLHRDISTLIRESRNREDYIKNFLIRIIPILRSLSDIDPNVCKYNHGDFHSQNVMVNENGDIKIIDFGFSRIEDRITGNFIQTNNDNTRYCESRDTTRLLYDLRYWQLVNMYPQLTHAFRDFINRVLCVECDLRGATHNHRNCFSLLEPRVRDPILGNHHGISYTWFNTHNNIRGNFTDMLRSVNRLFPAPVAPARNLMPPPAPRVPVVPVVPVAPPAAPPAVAVAPRAPTPPPAAPAPRRRVPTPPPRVLTPMPLPTRMPTPRVPMSINQTPMPRHPVPMNMSQTPNQMNISQTLNQMNISGGNNSVENLKLNKGSIAHFMNALHTVDNFWTIVQTFTGKSGGKRLKTRKRGGRSGISTKSPGTYKSPRTKSYKSPRTKSPRTKSPRKSHKNSQNIETNIREAVIDDYEHYSVINLYHFIRFNAFPKINNDDKMKLFMDIVNVPLRNSEVFNIIVRAVNNNDFKMMKSIRNMKHNADFPYKKIWEKILKAYFKEDDMIRSFNLLQYLLYLRPHDGGDVIKILKDFIDSYMKSDDRDFIIPKQNMELITI